MKVIEKAYAKINLALQVENKRGDGYHNLKMIMVPLELHDTITVCKGKKDEVITDKDIKNNIIYEAIRLFKEEFLIKEHVKVKLKKRIPIGSGLAGGSADASATIRALNRYFGINKSLKELESIVLKLGSDTLFCLYNEPAHIYGRGEYYEFINYPSFEKITLFSPNIEVSTKKVFDLFTKSKIKRDFNVILDLYKEDSNRFLNATYNDLLSTTMDGYPALKALYERIKGDNETLYMTGSGSTFYIIGHDFSKNIKKIPNIRIIKTFIKQKNAYK
ncbi:4-(cytidine 5'-diphospho)-2-C-methyl-D-erythritol kinase [Acholeplasma sp. OttesenSCG-928-E16]|nr:4-(cytidine 5'-diphospho)-2-C-methyl-D-erythritol kinase [Acholeplasma sp. OttesenSCG-928-E16]